MVGNSERASLQDLLQSLSYELRLCSKLSGWAVLSKPFSFPSLLVSSLATERAGAMFFEV